MGDHLVVRVKVKDILEELGSFKMSSDFMDRLDEKVRLLIEEAVRRAEANNRHTVMAKDL